MEYCDHIDDVGSFDAILSVGTAVNPSLPWTTINSNGWLARVSSGTRDLPADVCEWRTRSARSRPPAWA